MPLVFFNWYLMPDTFSIFFYFFSETIITIMKERIWINRVSSEIVFSVFASRHCPLHDERIIAVRGAQLHLESHQRDVTDGMQSL